jgi:hypothetical protein
MTHDDGLNSLTLNDLQFEGGLLVKVRGVRYSYMNGNQLLNLIRGLGILLCKLNNSATGYQPDHFEADADDLKPGEDRPMKAEAFLRDLAEKLMHIAPNVIGTDGYHIDRLNAIAGQIAAARPVEG